MLQYLSGIVGSHVFLIKTTGFLGTRPPKLNTMELTPFGSMSGTIVPGAICSCLLFTSCSSDEDPVKSYSNYRIIVDAASPVSFTALGETRTITVSASKEICLDGKPSGETEPAKVTASVEGEHFMSESSHTDAGLLLKITARENKTEEMQKGKVVLTIQDDTTTETQAVEIILAANPNGDSYFVSTEISGIYKE